MRKRSVSGLACVAALLFAAGPANATLIGFEDVSGDAVAAVKTTSPPNPVSPNPNDGILLAWDELQNVVLIQDLAVDRVFDTSASFIEPRVGGGWWIKAGTVVSSHYFQWDPLGSGGSGSVDATLVFDATIFAFITRDGFLFSSDPVLGLPQLDYSDFGLRGLEAGDTTIFNNERVDIHWTASSPGDWTRLITAFSPAADPVIPEPTTLTLIGLGVAGLVGLRRRSRK